MRSCVVFVNRVFLTLVLICLRNLLHTRGLNKEASCCLCIIPFHVFNPILAYFFSHVSSAFSTHLMGGLLPSNLISNIFQVTHPKAFYLFIFFYVHLPSLALSLTFNLYRCFVCFVLSSHILVLKMVMEFPNVWTFPYNFFFCLGNSFIISVKCFSSSFYCKHYCDIPWYLIFVYGLESDVWKTFLVHSCTKAVENYIEGM